MKKKVFYTVLIIFILSLIPMYAIGMYAHPSVDDYYYGDLTRVVWEETHSLSAVISASFDEMLTTYDEWQGNFSAIFLMRLQPGIFGEQYYSIAPFILITAYVLCSLLFYYVALKNIFNADRLRSSIVAVCITFVSIQLVDTPSDSFYWFNGSIYYTFFHSLMLLMFSLMIIIKKMHGPIIILPCLGSILLAFFIGGSNFATALFTAIVLTLTAFYTIYCARNRRNGFYMAHGFIYWLIFFAALTGLFLSIKAPGNAVRQASVGQSSSLIITFIYTV